MGASLSSAKTCNLTNRLTGAAVHIRQHDPDAVDTLVQAIRHGQLTHELARLTLARRERKMRDKAVRELTDQDITVTDTEPRYHGDGPPLLSRLRSPDAPTGRALTPEDHATCPGHVAHVEVTIYEADPEQGAEEETDVTVTYGCTDPAEHGHLDVWSGRNLRTVELPEQDVPDDEDEQARADRLARQEQDRAEAEAEAVAAQEARDARRELIRLNKESDAAQQVRREFIRASLTARSRQKAMSAWAIERVVRRDRTYCSWTAGAYNPCPVLADILGQDHTTTTAQAPATRHGIILWAHVAAAYESVFYRDAHRQTSPALADYLRHLVDLGYVPADVERRIIAAVYPEPTPILLIDLDLDQDEAVSGDTAELDADPAGTDAGEVMPATAA